MAQSNEIQIGTREVWKSNVPVSITDHDAFQHVYINGKTGTGKSALMRSMYAQVISNGHGCTLLDLNGDLAVEVLDDTPPSRIEDVKIIDPTDDQHVFPINPFYNVPDDRIWALAEEFVHACKDIFVDGWGDRMDYIFVRVVAAVLYAPAELRPTLMSIPMFLSVAHYRNAILKHVRDPVLKLYFDTEFKRYTGLRRSDYILPIENKIGKLIGNPFIRNLLSPYNPSFQLQDAIKTKSILIIRLPKGKLGKTAPKLIGSMIASTIINAAYQQDELPEAKRLPHFFFTDEKHNLPTKAYIPAYNDQRHNKFSMIVASQYTDQLDEEEQNAIFGNVGTIIAFRSSPNDAKRFYDQIGKFPASRYNDLRLGEIFIRLLRDGSPTEPFQAFTSVDHVQPFNLSRQIIEYNHRTYCISRDDVEQAYQRWIRKTFIDPAERKEQNRQASKRREQKKQVVFSHTPIEDDGSITERGQKAITEIRKITEEAAKKHQAKQPRYPIFKVPNRRKQRRSKNSSANK